MNDLLIMLFGFLPAEVVAVIQILIAILVIIILFKLISLILDAIPFL